MKYIFLRVLAIFLLVLLCIPAYASERENRPDDEIYSIPDDFDLRIQQQCSGHSSFIHYLVREDGWFAVYYRTAENTDTQESVFSRAYVDVFNAHGEFQIEISFISRDDLTLNFSSNVIEIYLSEFMLSVDLSTHEVTKIQISRHYAKENGLHSKFINKTQTADGWSYSCDGSSMNYTSLVREKDNTREVILFLSGSIYGTERISPPFAIVSAISCAILLISYLVWRAKRNQLKKRKN